jgi:hypothetical protein
MKALRDWLQHHGFDPAGLRPLCGHDKAAAFALAVSAEQARPIWEQLREVVAATGYWPVILNDRGEGFPLPAAAATDPDQRGGRTFAELLAAASTIDFEGWVREQHDRRIASLKEDVDLNGEEDDLSEYPRQLLAQRGELRGLPRAAWPGDDPVPLEEIDDRLATFAERPDCRLTAALFPVPEGWQVPAFLRWRAQWWPHDLALHAAALRSWQERYQAELVTLGTQTMHLRVGKPPTTRRAALQLAREHFYYCQDVIPNRVDSLDEVAAWLIRGRVWYFVWDD